MKHYQALMIVKGVPSVFNVSAENQKEAKAQIFNNALASIGLKIGRKNKAVEMVNLKLKSLNK